MALEKTSYRTQIFAFFLFIAVLFLIFFGIVTARNTSSQIRKQYENTFNAITDQVNLNLDTLLSDIERVGSLHLINDDIMKILKTDYNNKMNQYALDSNLMRTQISQANRLNTNVLFSLFQNKHDFLFDYNIRTQTDMNKAVENMELLAVKARKSPRNSYFGAISPLSSSMDLKKNVIPMVKILYDANSTEEIGLFYVGISVDSIFTILNSSQIPNSELSFFNQDNEVVFSSNENFWNDEKNNRLLSEIRNISTPDLEINEKISQDIVVDSEIYTVNILRNKITNWHIIHLMDHSVITQAYYQNLKSYFAIFLAISISGIFLSLFFSRSLSKSIESLCHQIDRQHAKDGYIQIENGISNRELQKVIDSYNRLNRRLIDSMNQNYEIQLNEKQIHLQMLKNQINPHFLYNTLNSIYSIANIHDIEEIRIISTALSDILRHNLKSGPFVSLKSELEIIHKFMEIQNIRFPGKYIFECDVPESFFSSKVPTFILQPIIENSILHGLDEKESNALINISAYADQDFFHILISDNGNGIRKKRLMDIQAALAENKKPTYIGNTEKSSSIGLFNVHSRIHSYYGDGYGVNIQSRKRYGTIVDIILPPTSYFNESIPEEFTLV